MKENNRVNKRTVDYMLLVSNILLLVMTIALFINSPPAMDIYNYYDYVDVILSKAFVVTIVLYIISVVLILISVIRMFKVKSGKRSIGVIMVRVITFLLFIGVTFYLLGYLGFYETFDINFVMPFRGYHPPF